MEQQETRPSRTDVRVEWFFRIALLVVLAASPWPFGSATPRPAGVMVAVLLVLFATFLVARLHQGSATDVPAKLWILAATALVAIQLVPLPGSLVDVVAPSVAAVYAPLQEHFGIAGWHALSVEPFQTRVRLLQLSSFFAAYVLATHLFRRGSDRRLFAYTIAALGVALSIFAIYQKARFGSVLYGRFPTPSGSSFGPFVNHNHFAGFVEVCGLITLGTTLGAARRSPSLAVLLGGAAVLMGTALALSHSRGGLLATSAGLLMLAALAGVRDGAGRRVIGASALAVVLLLAALAPSSVFDRFATLGDPAADTSVQFRLRLWSDSLDMASASPVLGSGLGTYAAMVSAYRTDEDETRAEFAESDWMQLLCETGGMGVLIALGFLVTVARHARAGLRTQGSHRSRGVLLGCFAGAGALVVHGLYDFNLQIPANALLFAMVLGALSSSEADVRTWRPRRWHALAAAPVVLALVTLSVMAVEAFESRVIARNVNPLLAEPSEFTGIIRDLARSRRKVASNPQTAYLLGRLYSEDAYRSKDAARYRDARFEQAAEAFRDAVRLGPARGRYWFELAWTEANRREDALADALFEEAIRLEPQWANLRANYALYLASRGRIDEALTQLEHGRELSPGLSPMDALDVIAPYVNGDAVRMRRAAGTGERADEAIARYGAAELESDR